VKIIVFFIVCFSVIILSIPVSSVFATQESNTSELEPKNNVHTESVMPDNQGSEDYYKKMDLMENQLIEIQMEEAGSASNIQNVDYDTEAIIQKTGLDKIKPKYFVSYFNGNEQFLQNCSTPLCTKIILNNSGINYAKSEQWEEAENAFKEALSNDPDYEPAKLNLGLVYDKIKTKKEAVDYWLKVYNIKL